jgi:hypothetical protein
MILSEKEARERWCPFARVSGDDGKGSLTPGCNRIYSRDADSRRAIGDGQQNKCVGSACMAWRWLPDPNGIKPNCGRGYCGLAGAAGVKP